jgi:hypothetical protein
MGSINNLTSSYLQSVLNSALQSSGLTTNSTQNTAASTSTSSVAPLTDSQQLSPFAQLMSTLQQLQQTDPTKYQQVTQQIATNLQSAAQTATASGNTTAATQLTQLSTDFTNASKSGQLPNVQDLAQAIGGHHHHHHHAHAAAADSDADSSTNGTSTTPSSSTSQALSQFLSGTQTGAAPNDPLNPMSIILSTLANAGVTTAQA